MSKQAIHEYYTVENVLFKITVYCNQTEKYDSIV